MTSALRNSVQFGAIRKKIGTIRKKTGITLTATIKSIKKTQTLTS
jgi:hypothetical protein